MIEKPIEWWAAMVAAAGFVFLKNRHPSPVYGAIVAAISAALGLSLAGDISAWVGWPENLVMVLIVALGYFTLDTGIALFQDRDLVRDIIRRRRGGGDDG